MKKRTILISLMVIILIAGLFILTGCGIDNKENQNTQIEESSNNLNAEKKELIFEDNIGNSGYKTTFAYYDNDFEITGTGVDVNGKFSSINVESKKLNVSMKFAYTYYDHAKAYSGIKSNDSKTKYYTEYSWNNYQGYLRGGQENYLSFMIPLEVTDSHDLILVINVQPLLDKKASVVDACKSKTMQEFLKTIEFKQEK